MQANRENMRAYRDRWKAVAAREAEELRASTIDQRWRKLNAVQGIAIGLGFPLRDDPDIDAARRRWAKLKRVDTDSSMCDRAARWSSNIVPTRHYGPKGGPTLMEAGELVHLLTALSAVQRLIELHHDRGVVIGGVAAGLLGKPRLTADVDAMILIDVEDVPILLGEAAQEGLVARFSDTEDFARQSRVVLLSHQQSGVDVDISLGTLPFETEMVERSRVQQAGSLSIRLPTPEDLIIMKTIAHRPQDLLDIQGLIQANPNLDRQRIRLWVGEFAELLEQPELWNDIAGWLHSADQSNRA